MVDAFKEAFTPMLDWFKGRWNAIWGALGFGTPFPDVTGGDAAGGGAAGGAGAGGSSPAPGFGGGVTGLRGAAGTRRGGGPSHLDSPIQRPTSGGVSEGEAAVEVTSDRQL